MLKNKLRRFIPSFRLRTLPLSVSGIVVGSSLAVRVSFSWTVFLFALLTTLCLQVLSNLSNELGDALRGADDEERKGPKYGLQSGFVSQRELKACIWIFAGLSAVLGVLLVWSAFGTLFSAKALVFLALGGLAIAAALKYTLGAHPYGYQGMGDLSVFLFFGLLSVFGSYFLQCVQWDLNLFLPASAVGLLSVAVLNVNNMRDMETDVKNGKRTLASRLGLAGARIYHLLLVVISMSIFALLECWWVLLLTPFFVAHLYFIFSLKGEPLDSQLPFLSVLTLLTSFLFSAFVLF